MKQTFKHTLHTNGGGYWSEAVRDVNVTGFAVAYTNNELDFGELRVYFNTRTWDVNELGLIYTDNEFMKQFKGLWNVMGINGVTKKLHR